jgi:hypothetical protein
MFKIIVNLMSENINAISKNTLYFTLIRTVESKYLSHYENEGKITNKDSYWKM